MSNCLYTPIFLHLVLTVYFLYSQNISYVVISTKSSIIVFCSMQSPSSILAKSIFITLKVLCPHCSIIGNKQIFTTLGKVSRAQGQIPFAQHGETAHKYCTTHQSGSTPTVPTAHSHSVQWRSILSVDETSVLGGMEKSACHCSL